MMVRGLTWVVAGIGLAVLLVVVIVPGGPRADVLVPVLLTVAAGSLAMGWAVVARRRDEEAHRRSLELVDGVRAQRSSSTDGAPAIPDVESNERKAP